MQNPKIHISINQNNTSSSILSLLKPSRNVAELKQLHAKIIKTKSNDIDLWNATISAYADSGMYRETIELFNQMQCEGIQPDEFIFCSVINACVEFSGSTLGKQIHDLVVKYGFGSDFHIATALVNMYGKCGYLKDARQVFDEMPHRDVFLWNTMIAAYVQNKQPITAVEMFCQMYDSGVRPDQFTLINMISVFAEMGNIEYGKLIHVHVAANGFESDPHIAAALINMYAKCDGIEMAKEVFDGICERDVALWTAMIVGYAMHGDGEHALEVFSEMQEAGVSPDHVTFVGVLSACSRAGLVDEGCQYFNLMTSKFGIEPNLVHYGCMVDLLGRAGLLDEAYDFIKRMPLKPDAGVWGALLNACKIHCNSELAQHAAEHLFMLEPKNTAFYMLLSEIYAADHKWDDLTKLMRRIEEEGLIKPE